MQAAILAAGLGTRLRPLTYRVPKALLPVLNRPLLGLLLEQLQAAGFTRVAVNTHHLADQVQRFLAEQRPPGLEIEVSHEPEILGTGGGLRGLGEILGGGSFLVVNADIVTDLDLGNIYHRHLEQAITTLVVHDHPPYNKVWVERNRVVSIGEPPPGGAGRALAYTGVQVVSPEIFRYIPATGPYDLVAAWREALAAGERLEALVALGHYWQDLGTPANYLAAHWWLLTRPPSHLASFFPGVSDPLIGPGAMVGGRVHFGSGVCLGAGVSVGAGAFLKNTVIMDNAVIAPRITLEDCIVGPGAEVAQSARGKILV
ncbi:MAG: NDP-sugar synthase [Deltaproteobacteria bacterium]|nr:NDP-sugar synthase [Deltaproteobacteria bacterium]